MHDGNMSQTETVTNPNTPQCSQHPASATPSSSHGLPLQILLCEEKEMEGLQTSAIN